MWRTLLRFCTRCLDMGVVEGVPLAINQIDELVGS